MNKSENITFCTECGNKNNKINSFCSSCGNEFEQVKIEYIKGNNTKTSNIGINEQINKISAVDISMDDIDIDEMNMFISKNTDYYNRKFEQMNKNGNKRTWNWAAFFLNIYWLLYRKMYIQGAILFGASLVIGGISSMISSILGLIISWGINIGVGMYANSMYLDHIKKKLNDIDSMAYESKVSMIMKKGGTNIVLPLILLGGYILLIVGAMLIFGVVLGSLLYY